MTNIPRPTHTFFFVAAMKVPAPVAKIFDVGDIFGKDGKPDTETLMTHFKNEGRVSEAAAIRVSFTSPPAPSSITTACVQIHWTSCVAIFSLSSSPFQPSLYPQTIYNPLFPLLSFLPHTYALLFLTPALLSLFLLCSLFPLLNFTFTDSARDGCNLAEGGECAPGSCTSHNRW